MERIDWKRDGFVGQRVVVAPRPMLRGQAREMFGRMMIVTDAGYFPRAAQHRVVRPAGREELILIYCVQGVGWVDSGGGGAAQVRAGQLAVLPAGSPHAYGADEQSPWSIYWVHLRGLSVTNDVLPPLRQLAGECFPVLNVGLEPVLSHRFEEIVGTYDHGISPTELLIASGLAMALAAQIAAAARRATSSGAPAAIERVAGVIRQLRTRLDEPIALETLARSARLSTQHFSALFKELTGFPPHAYFLRLRLARAMERVVGSQELFKHIAADLGFASQLYFSRQFSKLYGMSPTRARQTESLRTTADQPSGMFSTDKPSRARLR